MKVVKIKAEVCNGCGACMTTCSRVLYKVEDPAKSAIRIKEKADNPGSYEISVCNHCGECISVCNIEALYRAKNGAVRLDAKKCAGCYMCVGFCTHGAMFVHPQINEPIKCIACGACARVCPTGAIYMDNV